MLEVNKLKDILKDLKILVHKDNHYLKFQETKDQLKDPIENQKQCLKEVNNKTVNCNHNLLMLLNTKK